MQLRLNCTIIGDYTEQAKTTGHIFIDKVYDKILIERRITEVAQMYRIALVKKKKLPEQYSD